MSSISTKSTSVTTATDLYRRGLLSQFPRLLGALDREASSITAGCADRSFWAWKFVDFPGARFQECVCALSFMFKTSMAGNPYCGNPRLLEWIRHALRFWSRIQHRDGSFDEAYPFERSLAASAFTGFYVGEALHFLEGDLPAEARSTARASLARAGKWLIRNDETHGFLSNHLAAAAGALYHAYRQTGEESFEKRSNYFVDRILDHQSEEGWYDEYGGADPGYQTHGTFYLARLWQFAPNDNLLQSLARSTHFLSHFVHADGSLGGEYASRNTQTYYPAAFEMLAHRDAAAAWIAQAMLPSLKNMAAAGAASVDRYNLCPCLNNLVFAYQAAESRVAEPQVSEPSPAGGLAWFPAAGLARVRTPRYEAYVGTNKGGVIKVFDRDLAKLVYNDCGYTGRLHNGKLVGSQDESVPICVEKDAIEIRGGVSVVARPQMTPLLFVGFRIFMLTLGRFPMVARWLKQQLVRVLIYRKNSLDVQFTRRIEFSPREVRVKDAFSGPGGRSVDHLAWRDVFTTIHMGSSRYFVPNELGPLLAEGDVESAVSGAQIVSGVESERRVNFS